MSEEYIISELKRRQLCTSIQSIQSLSGGCISTAQRYSTDTGDFFVKTNSDAKAEQWFLAESLALERMHEAVPGFVPRPLFFYSQRDHPAFIVTEFMRLSTAEKRLPDMQRQLGTSLAHLHSHQAPQYGFPVTSFCGTTQLNNTPNSNWCDFFRHQRLQPLLDAVAGQNPDLDRLGQSVVRHLDHLLADIHQKPSLLHGDLWNGNWAVRDHQPVIFDPASYYGHHEAEFGIMKMFGGFTSDCFDAYYDVAGCDEPEEERLRLYEMYHHLNHFFMFGEGYDTSCVSLMESLL
ncbi:Fructosamine/Ketosamine-3-kinase [Mucor mucedo]|uniref:Fructosamine/Ketosamine-3-kinase n=1 Tax=Mucor mucedo TaxID=29922 RepID=UPI00221ED14E|nr:Fructosamine/Ketosamine-3-kinase [Mucor mucedo]KAI7888985.1 Fructosamine/Ketosamine-3-kinase [Mucor mucedo]